MVLSPSDELSRDGDIRTTWSWWGLVAVLFGLSCAQFPLYHDTQNQYFFHGLLRAGVGLLRFDWLAGTADTWPVFSALVALTYRFLDARAFYVYFFILLGLYAYGMWGIVSSIWVIDRSWPKTLAFMALLAALHSPWIGALSTTAVGFSVGGQFTSGVALQGLLGQMLQPSTFGVFLLLSVLACLRGRALPAVVWAALAATIHPTYILTAAALVLSYVIIEGRRQRRLREPLRLGLWAVVLFLPVLVYVMIAFRPTSPAITEQAQAILVHFRFPHHASPARWLGPMVYVKLAVVVAALALARRSDLFVIFLVLLGATIGLTLLQLLSGSDALALLFPWRLSVLLVPISTVLIGAAAISWGVDRLVSRAPGSRRLVAACGAAVLVVLAVAGSGETRHRFSAGRVNHRTALMEFVRTTRSPDALYLIPPYWDNFRLASGAPTFSDWDFIPYNDVAVVEWHRRFRLADAFYTARGGDRCRALRDLKSEYPITHVAVREQPPEPCEGWQLLFEAGDHRLYRVVP